MKGDKVIVRTYGDEPKMVRVWEVTPTTVFVCSEENYETLLRGEEGLLPVGFPKEYVFRYNPKQDAILNSSTIWNELILYAQ
jgi:hypothetical protein